jgi:hypothetical protein
MTTSRTDLLSRDRAFALGRLLAVTLVAGSLGSACAPDDPSGGGAPPNTEAKTSGLAIDGLHGFMLLSGGHPDLAVNAYGGAYNGGAVKEYRGCWWENGACTWTYRNGILFSDYDDRIAIRAPSESPVEDDVLIQSSGCSGTGTVPASCKWIYRDGRLISAANPNLAVYASGKHGADLVLSNGCLTNSTSNCRWVIQSAMIGSVVSGDALMYNAWGGVSEGGPVRLADACTRDNPACTWTFDKGMILSDANHFYALNAWGGNTLGAQIALSLHCDTSNPSCRWRLENGILYSDTSIMTVTPASQTNGANLFLQNFCFHNNCKVDMPVGGPQCGQSEQAPCLDGKCAKDLTPVGGKCVPLMYTTFRCPGTGALDAGTVDGALTFAFSNAGDWAFGGHVHDSGPVGLDYTLGFTFNKSIDGKRIGFSHNGTVHGTLDIGSRNSNFLINGWDQRLVDNWPALFSGGISCKLKSTANGWLIVEDALVGLGLATVATVGALGFISDAHDAPNDGCRWESDPNSSDLILYRTCP